MCNLYNLKVRRWEVASYYEANEDFRRDTEREEMEKPYVAPGRPGWVIRQQDGKRGIDAMTWGWPNPRGGIGTFAGIWRPSELGPIYAFLTCGYDGEAQEHVVGAIHPKAIPVVLHDEDFDRWLRAPVEDALPLACAFPSQLMAVA